MKFAAGNSDAPRKTNGTRIETSEINENEDSSDDTISGSVIDGNENDDSNNEINEDDQENDEIDNEQNSEVIIMDQRFKNGTNNFNNLQHTQPLEINKTTKSATNQTDAKTNDRINEKNDKNNNSTENNNKKNNINNNNNNENNNNTNNNKNNNNNKALNERDRTINEPNMNISLLESERKAVKASREEDCRLTFIGDGLQEYHEQDDNDAILNEIMRCFKNRTDKNRIDKIKKCRISFDEDVGKFTLLIVACNKEDVMKMKGKWPTNAFKQGITRIKNKDIWTICFDLKDDIDDEVIHKLESLGIYNPTRHVTHATNKATILVKAKVKCMENFLKLFRIGFWINNHHIDIYPWIYPPRLCNTCGRYGHNNYDGTCKTPQGQIRCLKCAAAHSTNNCSIKSATELLCYFCHEEGDDDNHAAFSGIECCKFKMEQVKHNRYVFELLQDAGLIKHEFEALKQHMQATVRNKKKITKPIINKATGESGLDKDTMALIERFIINRFNNGIMPKFREETESLKKSLNKQIDGFRLNINNINNNIESITNTVNVHGEFINTMMDSKVVENIIEIRSDQRQQMKETKQTNELLKMLLKNNGNKSNSDSENLNNHSSSNNQLVSLNHQKNSNRIGTEYNKVQVNNNNNNENTVVGVASNARNNDLF